MRKLILALLILSGSAFAQGVIGNGLWQFVWAAPSGACNASAQPQLVVGPGTVYTCQSATWTLASSSGGGSGTVSACAAAGNSYYSGAGSTVVCDTQITDNGSGTLTIPTAAVTTFSGAPNFTGTPTFAAGAGLGTGTFSGAATLSGNIAFSGTPTFSNALALGSSTATSQSAGDNSTKVATTAYVRSEVQYTWSCHMSAALNGSANSCQFTTPSAGITVTGFELYAVTAENTCTTHAILQVQDTTSAAEVGSYAITFVSGTNSYTQVTGSTAVTGGHKIAIRVATAAATCTTVPAGVDATVTYQMTN